MERVHYSSERERPSWLPDPAQIDLVMFIY
jgi:hypothetical protein